VNRAPTITVGLLLDRISRATQATLVAMSGMSPKLYRENMTILMVLQAIYDRLTANVVALHLDFADDRRATAYFVL
jgi:hypothetical protein